MENSAARRLAVIANHTAGVNPAGGVYTAPCAARNDREHDLDGVKWNGWGYSDSSFQLASDNETVYLTGERYEMAGKAEWARKTCGLDVNVRTPAKASYGEFPKPIRNEGFVTALDKMGAKHSFEDYVRLHHGHGHTNNEIFRLRYGKFERIPDVVVWPRDHGEVERLVAAATEADVCLIPFGGGTSVTEAVLCPEDERRMIVSVDMKDMNNILWVNSESQEACVQAGCIGVHLDAALRAMGFTIGHEPDSFEFSSVGGWVATRASGMKKNTYGNIEDIVVQVKFVTPRGTLIKGSDGPRQSTGPDVNHFIMGSEGIFGIVTEVVVRVRALPEAEAYGSIVFPSFDQGCQFMREVARHRCAPASIRLVDNAQFKFGQTLKPRKESAVEGYLDAIKKFYVTRLKGFDVEKMAACTLVFLGTKAEVAAQQKKIYSLARGFGGIPGGEENGKRGYFLTYSIAYLRDFVLEFSLIAESFETSISWAKMPEMIRRVKARLHAAVRAERVRAEPFISARVTQTYETGACVYFYFGFLFKGLSDPMASFHRVEQAARDEVLKCGGSLSHHHGIGKLRKAWMPDAITPTGLQMIKAIKKEIDPKNIFGSGNLLE